MSQSEQFDEKNTDSLGRNLRKENLLGSKERKESI